MAISARAVVTNTPGWEPVGDDAHLFSLDKRVPGGWGLRTPALRLRDGTLALVSPTIDLGDAAHASLARLGEVSLLLAPNHFHNMGLPEYLARYPRARALSSDVARPRLAKKHRAIAFTDLAALRERLPEGAAVLEPAGTRSGEVFLKVPTSLGTAWVVGDAFFNEPTHPHGAIGVFCRLTGTTAGLRLGNTFRWLALRDRAAYRAWLLEQLARDPPTVLMPLHGSIEHDPNLPARLRSLAETRLP